MPERRVLVNQPLRDRWQFLEWRRCRWLDECDKDNRVRVNSSRVVSLLAVARTWRRRWQLFRCGCS